jgi:hypothetical protein
LTAIRSFLVVLVVCLASSALAALPPCVAASKPSGLPLPSAYATNQDPQAYQKLLYAYLDGAAYKTQGWCGDKAVRDTGPWIDNAYQGTHPAVRIYYSPEVMQWLVGGRKGELPDGAMIIKEQYSPPSARYAGMNETQLDAAFAVFKDWTIMIRDRKGAADGWYWAELWSGMTFDSYAAPFAIFNGGFGLYCTRCHASAEGELTFASTTNIAGFPGTPLTFRDDGSWRCANDPLCPGYQPPQFKAPVPLSDESPARVVAAPNHPAVDPDPVVETAPTNSLTGIGRFFTVTLAKPNEPIAAIPGENYDHVPAHKGQHFLTSDQCMGCHGGLKYGNVMVATDQQLNVSPYAEWRWSPMGLAGRDPIFYAQLESEIQYLDSRKDPDKPAIVNLCFSCHGVMGERQLHIDSGGKELFSRDIINVTTLSDRLFKYGALARDGVSCASCHHIASTEKESFSQFIQKNITGQFTLGPADQLFGPFKDDDIVQFPMEEALAMTPKHHPYIQSSRMCGSCHTIKLPVLDETPVGHSFEQLTYLEWVNSSFENEFNRDNPDAQSCQACHMRNTFDGIPVKTKIAAIEDESYPMADFRAPDSKINVRYREQGYARHQLQGLNVFLLEMFSQFSNVLGVRTCDYMLSGCNNANPFSSLPVATSNMVKQARNDTATVFLAEPRLRDGKLVADVTVTNLVGHRFPSGVSFRRAFIEFTVTDRKSGKLLFGSGRTNDGGWIINDEGKVLPSEWNGMKGPKGQFFQPHFYAPSQPITSSDQVQIYEELLKDAEGQFTTSFIRQAEHFKDNRLLPRGWTKEGPNPKEFNGRALEATYPHNVGTDPNFANGNGRSVVRYEVALPQGTRIEDVQVAAKLYYQAIPPYYLNQRFEQVPNGVATKRLYQLVTRLQPQNTAFPNWKLYIAGANN